MAAPKKKQSSGCNVKNLNDFLSNAVEDIEKRYSDSNFVDKVATGFCDIDIILGGGFTPGELVVIGARPGMGKSSFMSNIILYNILKLNLPILCFTPECQGKIFSERLLSQLARIDRRLLRSGALTDQDWHRLTTTLVTLSKVNLLIQDTSYLTLDQIVEDSKAFCKANSGGIIFIDYIQLIKIPGFPINALYEEVSAIAKELKTLAGYLNTTIIIVSQLNRGLESRPDKKPILRDLRDSGHLEEDADVVIFLYRDEVYYEDSREKGIAEVSIAKNRHGQTGKARLKFLSQYQQFENIIPGLDASLLHSVIQEYM